jgi:CheY-like chemotaxis protein
MSEESFSVVLVDDDRITRDIFKMVFENQGLDLTVLEDAETALAYLESHTPDVLVLDIMLPGLDGYQALARIRKNGVARGCRIVATTAYYENDTEMDVIARGFDAFLPKPLRPVNLVEFLRNLSLKGKSSIEKS